MKHLIGCLLLTVLITNAHSSCNVKTDIVKKDGHYAYSIDCHKMVGKLLADEKDRKRQIAHLNKTIKLKDLSLDLSGKRAILWQKEAENQYVLLKKHAKWRSYERYIWFGGGVALTVLGVWGAGQLSK